MSLEIGDNLTVSSIEDGQAVLYDDAGRKFVLDLEDPEEKEPGMGRLGTAATWAYEAWDHGTAEEQYEAMADLGRVLFDLGYKPEGG